MGMVGILSSRLLDLYCSLPFEIKKKLTIAYGREITYEDLIKLMKEKLTEVEQELYLPE